ncbi:hypothetical protein AB0H57_06600 [Micromonospora sp. NPDC050686]|uniref:hypothetical protein n=1 Tax=Micromonospora sp. NPDC050686 TaxID=3154631 RepID=UPI0033E613A9
MSFVQIVEYETDRPDEMRMLSEQWERERPANGPSRLTFAEDQEKPGHFVIVAEFDTYEQAMAHSGQPQTSAYAERIRTLAKGDPRFVNLKVDRQQT